MRSSSEGAPAASAQTYHSGQNLQPVFEGWEQNGDGSFNMVFGYLNRNYEEHLNVPVGPDNYFEPGAADQGQPTFFYPRRQRIIFRVRVPADWGDKELVWTVTAHGRTDRAVGWLVPEQIIDAQVVAMNRSGGGAPDIVNAAPSHRTGREHGTFREGGRAADPDRDHPRRRYSRDAPRPARAVLRGGATRSACVWRGCTTGGPEPSTSIRGARRWRTTRPAGRRRRCPRTGAS